MHAHLITEFICAYTRICGACTIARVNIVMKEKITVEIKLAIVILLLLVK